MLPLSQALSYPKGLGALCIEQADKGQEKGEVSATSYNPNQEVTRHFRSPSLDEN